MIYDIQERNFMIPSLTIQPLVENAIKHGISAKEENGTIILKTEKIGKKIKISIIDDGIGFVVGEHDKDGKTHVGINNVKTRLYYLLSAEMNIQSDSNGTKVEVIINNKIK
jgi:LytS/YehU family sensor histidine kinase